MKKKIEISGEPYHFYGKKNYTNHRGEIVERRIAISGVYNNGVMNIGVAACGNSDSFNKKLGRTISLGRAVKKDSRVDEVVMTGEKIGHDFVQWCVEYCK